jgi:hypothetical protein
VSSPYVGLNVLHAQITLPSDGDPAIAESVNTALRDLMDTSVYNTTENSHKIDDRGGVFTLTGSITIQGTPNWTFDVDTFFTEDVTHGSAGLLNDHVLGVYDELRVFGDANLRGNVTIGSGPSQSLTVQSPTTFVRTVTHQDDVTFDDDVEMNATLTVDGAATFNATTQLGSSATDTCTVGGPLVAQRDATFQNSVEIEGSLNAGNSSGDTHEFRGQVTFNNDVTLATASLTVGGDLEVTGDSILGSSDSDTVTIPASLVVSGDMTFNGQLANALTYTGFGRVPFRPGILTIAGTTTINVASGNVFYLPNNPAGTLSIASLSDTGAADGDCMIFIKAGVAGSFRVDLPSGGSISAGAPQALIVIVRIGGQWLGDRIQSA